MRAHASSGCRLSPAKPLSARFADHCAVHRVSEDGSLGAGVSVMAEEHDRVDARLQPAEHAVGPWIPAHQARTRVQAGGQDVAKPRMRIGDEHLRLWLGCQDAANGGARLIGHEPARGLVVGRTRQRVVPVDDAGDPFEVH
jgi:hypothetical protein